MNKKVYFNYKSKGKVKMTTFDKLGDYKRALKAFVRGAIKAKVFGTDEKNSITLTCSANEEDKTVTVLIQNDTYTADFTAEVSTRIFNKFNEELFAPIKKQFDKLKNFGGITVSF